jgi:hypothetical protein
MAESNQITIKSFPIPDGWRESPNKTVAVDMPPFTKILSADHDRNGELVVWGVVRSGWNGDSTVDYTIHVRKSNESIESDGQTATFIDMVTIDGEPHAIFVGGVTT